MSNQRSRLDSVCGWCDRCHFQKNSLISGDVRAAGDVLDGLVVDGQHRRADERLAVGVGQLELDLRLLARLVRLLRGHDRDVDHPRLRRDDDLAGLVVNLAAGDRQRLDEEVRHVARDDPTSSTVLLPREADDLRRQVDAVRRPDEQQDRGVDLVGVDQEPDLVAGLVFLLVGDELEVVEPELAPSKPWPTIVNT